MWRLDRELIDELDVGNKKKVRRPILFYSSAKLFPAI